MKEAKRQGVRHRIIHAHSSQSADTKLKKIRNKALAAGISFWANDYIAVSDEAAKKSFGSRRNVHIIENGIDTGLFRFDPLTREEVRRELNLPDDVLCVGNVARFAPVKNHDFLLNVFQILKRRENSVLVLVGDGHLEADIKKKARMGLSESVRFLGSRQDVSRLYQAFDIFMLPSLFEGFGLAAVEAQCAGLGCLVSENVPKSVTCGNIRFLPLGNAALWAETALELSKQPRTDGSDGVVRKKLDISTMCDKILKVYNSFPGSAL